MGLFGGNKKNSAASSQKTLVIITGCAGSGKTTVGKELAKQLGYTYVDKDTVTRDFTDFILKRLGSDEGDRESELYTKEILPIEYRVTFKVCREILDNGSNAVLTIPFISQIRDYNEWEKIKQVARFNSHVKFKFVWIEHNIDTEKANIKKRNARRDDNKLANWEKYAESVEGIAPDKRYEAFSYINDCEVNLETALAEVISWINK